MRLQAWLGLAGGLLALLAGGCTEDEVLETGNAPLALEVEIVNTETRFDFFAEFKISQIALRPIDPIANTTLGAPIGIILEEDDVLEVDLTGVTEFTPATVILSTGFYQLERIELSGFLLTDRDTFVNNTRPNNCAELHTYQHNNPIGILTSDLGPTDFDIAAEGENRIGIRVDAAALVDAFVNAWDCVLLPPQQCIFRTGRFPGTCGTNFRTRDFRAQATNFITFVR
jgi:hypothetical protein